MEQLRKALIQAKKEREHAGLEDVHLTAEGKSVSGPDQRQSASGHSEHAEGAVQRQGRRMRAAEAMPPQEVDITYRDTRVVELDATALENNRILCGAQSHEVTHAYKMLRTQVLQKLKLNEWNSLAVVSPREGNGKTLTAINLAISLAQEVKHSVLLVDLDLRNPSIAGYLGMALQTGITDFLLRDAPIKDILINPGLERLVLLGGYESLSHSSEVLGAPKLIRLVEELKQRYPNRIVIFDLPPMLLSDDALVFAPYVDAMLMVVEDGKTTPDDLEHCADALNGKPLLGSVLNRGEC